MRELHPHAASRGVNRDIVAGLSGRAERMNALTDRDRATGERLRRVAFTVFRHFRIRTDDERRGAALEDGTSVLFDQRHATDGEIAAGASDDIALDDVELRAGDAGACMHACRSERL